MTPLWLALAGAYGAVGVALGAFGAHGLRARVTPERLAVWHTATEYHLLHAVVLLGLALWLRIAPQAPLVSAAAACIAAGVLVFSGSLYVLVLADLRWLGAVTPLGGVLLIIGWVLIVVAAFRQPAL
ncbi:DUF423 domain-containing protein [Polycyclovorans algicola]|uniref:DUF423 domain-containing protein n=1 Tax=Polycyclovorans algicola TaxID=616992 RepID=UPI0004A70708|nr:DUF423 domain-containing protein [Polycyclovorans algicola]